MQHDGPPAGTVTVTVTVNLNRSVMRDCDRLTRHHSASLRTARFVRCTEWDHRESSLSGPRGRPARRPVSQWQ